MNAKNIIFGTLALAIVGGGAYFYFKNKKKSTLTDKLTSDLTSASSTSSTSSTPDKVLDNAPVTNAEVKDLIKLSKANDLAKIVSQLIKEQKPDKYPFKSERYHQQLVIDDYNKQLNDLGYKQENGLAVKL
jgi:hypothetical protein